MRVAIFQGPIGAEPPLLALERAAGAAAGAALLVMPELFVTGYNIGAAALRGLAEPQDGPTAQKAADIAARHRVTLLYGYAERDAAGAIYNSALLISAEGRRVANFRKLHLFGAMERAVFTAGSEPFVLADIGGLRMGMLICYDVEFPEMVRGLALRGADLVAVPTALMHPYRFVPDILVRTRAYENQLFLIYANRCGHEGDLQYAGGSCIIGPDGQELARAGDGEQMVSALLDPELKAASRTFNTYFQDRRPDLYEWAP